MLINIGIFILDLITDLFMLKAASHDQHDRMHPLYGIPRERVRAMKKTAQGRAELKRIRDH